MYPGARERQGRRFYNFVTKRGDCRGARSKISWTSSRPARRHLKYPSCILRGDDSRASSIRSRSRTAIAGRQRYQDAGISARTPRAASSRRASRRALAEPPIGAGLLASQGEGARNFTNCDSLLIGDKLRRAHRAVHRGEKFLDVFEHERPPRRFPRTCLFYCPASADFQPRGDRARRNASSRRAAAAPMEFAVERRS